MPLPHQTSLLAVKPARVKGGEIVVPVMVRLGEWSEVAASPAVWAALAVEVESAKARARACVKLHGAKPRSLAESAAAGRPLLKPGHKHL